MTTSDGVKLDGWEIPPENEDPSAFWILHLHGNSSNLGAPGYAAFYSQLRRMNLGVLALDYRGFGRSDGDPTEAGLYADGEAAFRFLRDVRQIPANRIAVYGFSLGSGVATELATRFEFAGLILDGAFTSIRDRTQEIYPYLPIRLLQNDRFASLGRMPSIAIPKLIIHAAGDSRVPISHGRALFAAAKSPKQFLEVPGEHDTAYKTDPARFYGGIEMFVTGLRSRSAPPPQ